MIQQQRQGKSDVGDHLTYVEIETTFDRHLLLPTVQTQPELTAAESFAPPFTGLRPMNKFNFVPFGFVTLKL